MQNFTGTGFSNEEIKKEDIVKQIESKWSKQYAINSLNKLGRLLDRTLQQKLEHGLFYHIDENRSKRAEQEAKKLRNEIYQLQEQIIEYLKAMPHD